MPASNNTKTNILNALIRGQAFTAPANLWVSLHTADPAGTGGDEANGTNWPSYTRRDSLQGDTLANAWSAPDGSYIVWNQKQIIFPVFDGPAELTITHFGLWTAETGGTFLVSGALTTPRAINTSQVFVADVDKLGVQVT